MSPVRPSGGESLQEMIDRYNRELMKMGRLGQSHSQPSAHPSAPPKPVQPQPPVVNIRPRPEPDEPLHRPGSGMPRPFPTEPLDEPGAPPFTPGMGAREQGLRDMEQGHRDREQGMRDIEQSRRDREQGMKDIAQGQRDREQGMRDIEQSRRDREQGMKDIAQGQRDREQGMRDIAQGQRDREQNMNDMPRIGMELEQRLRELRERSLSLEQKRQEYMKCTSPQDCWQHTDHSSPFNRMAVTAAATPEEERAQWLRDLEEGRRELEQGLRELEQGLRDREHGVRDYEQGLAEREYWLAQSRPAAAQPMAVPPSGQSSNRQVPVAPTVPGRVPAQKPSPTPPNDSYGTLIVQAFTARRAEPVPGAQVAVTQPGSGGEALIRVMTTDENGRTPPLRLPVSGLTEGAPSYSSPFANFNVYVNAEGFRPSGALNAQMFPGVTSLLPVELIPGEQVM